MFLIGSKNDLSFQNASIRSFVLRYIPYSFSYMLHSWRGESEHVTSYIIG